MTKVISYSLFGDHSSFEFNWYLRGAYFNIRMNRILLPDFHTTIHTTPELIEKYWAFWQGLGQLNKNITVQEESNNPKRCEGMLWRMIPLFDNLYDNADIVLCRDLDSVVTYREALCIHEWLNSNYAFHALNDNQSHGGLMGGLVGFKAKEFREYTKFKSFEQMIKGLELSKHGSDQNFLNKSVLPLIKNNLLLHKIQGAGCPAASIKTSVPAYGSIDKKYWVTDLISRYIGSAGVIDFEIMRFFRDHDNDPKFENFERSFPQIFYWQWK